MAVQLAEFAHAAARRGHATLVLLGDEGVVDELELQERELRGATPRRAQGDGMGGRCAGIEEAPYQRPESVGARAPSLTHAVVKEGNCRGHQGPQPSTDLLGTHGRVGGQPRSASQAGRAQLHPHRVAPCEVVAVEEVGLEEEGAEPSGDAELQRHEEADRHQH